MLISSSSRAIGGPQQLHFSGRSKKHSKQHDTAQAAPQQPQVTSPVRTYDGQLVVNRALFQEVLEKLKKFPKGFTVSWNGESGYRDYEFIPESGNPVEYRIEVKHTSHMLRETFVTNWINAEGAIATPVLRGSSKEHQSAYPPAKFVEETNMFLADLDRYPSKALKKR